MPNLGEQSQNWTCLCCRRASIDHPIGAYCYAKEKIELLMNKVDLLEREKNILKSLESECNRLQAELERVEKEHEHDHKWNAELLSQLSVAREALKSISYWNNVHNYTQGLPFVKTQEAMDSVKRTADKALQKLDGAEKP